MTVSYIFRGIHFEWDSRKASSNLSNHGISFETACEIFFDPFVSVVNFENHAGEPRESAIGMTFNRRVLYVVYTQRRTAIRIISARKVTKPERKRYEDD